MSSQVNRKICALVKKNLRSADSGPGVARVISHCGAADLNMHLQLSGILNVSENMFGCGIFRHHQCRYAAQLVQTTKTVLDLDQDD